MKSSSTLATFHVVTKSAEERNAEDVLLIDDLPVVRMYVTNFLAHAKHSLQYERKSSKRKPVN